METLVVVAQHRSHYDSDSKSHGPMRFGSCGTSPSKGFRGINCRTFQSGAGLLPTPLKPCTTSVAKPTSPKTPSLGSRSEEPKGSKRFCRSSPVSVPITVKPGAVNFDQTRSFNVKFHFSERWAGPAYSNSPPPSSVPIPKFSLRCKRTVSLELPSSASDIDLHPIAWSAPASPTRGSSSPPLSNYLFDDGNDSATKTLRRILNLDFTNE